MKGGDASGGGVRRKEQNITVCSLGFVQVILQVTMVRPAMEGFRQKLLVLALAWSDHADTIFHFCMRTAIVLGSGYVGFLLYIGMSYTDSWLEKLRLLPLLIVAVTIPLLGAVLIRKKHLMELNS